MRAKERRGATGPATQTMRIRSVRAATRFQWSVFHGRCRRNLIAGLVLSLLAGSYGAWAGYRFASHDDGAQAFDRAIVRLAAPMIRQPVHLRGIQPRNITEVYLISVIADERDALVGMTVLTLRAIIALTAGGLGLILLTAGATEWEIRSELNGAPEPPARLAGQS